MARTAARTAGQQEIETQEQQTEDEIDFDNGVIGVEALDDPGYYPMHHWLNYNPRLAPTQKALYGHLAGMVNTIRRRSNGDTNVWPTLELLAVMLGLSRGDKVIPHLDALEAERAVVKDRRWFKGLVQRNVYAVRFNPPPDYEGPVDMAQVSAHYAPLAAEMRRLDSERKTAQRANRRAKKAAEGTDPFPELDDIG